MIIVSVNKENGIIDGFSVSGHAGYKPRGEDIVCAAVSMLTQTTLLGLSRFIGEELNYTIDDNGIITCKIPDKLAEKEQTQSQAILETMILGLKNLQKNYSRYIRVFRRRWTS